MVTGGTAGIGRASVRCLAHRGWDIGVIARDQDRLAATVAEVEHLGRRALGVSADVADPRALDDAAERIETELGPVVVWVNNAFTGAIAFFDAVTAEEFERITAVTYLGYVNGTRAALARMAPRNRGTIIQVGSALAFRGIPLQAAYCGAKHAIAGFTNHEVRDPRSWAHGPQPRTARRRTGPCGGRLGSQRGRPRGSSREGLGGR
ncbi:MAG: SDR family NAD(P)-dependent oxidoreductase [Egibacteraceae bacterium]